MGLPSHSKKVMHISPVRWTPAVAKECVPAHGTQHGIWELVFCCEHVYLQGCCPLFPCHHRSIFMHPRHAVLWVGKL